MEAYYSNDKGSLYNCNCLDLMKSMGDGTVDCIATDPPYGYSFMGKDWDRAVPSVEIWKEALRILKDGAFAFVMSAPRQDVLMHNYSNLQQAGFDTAFTSIYWCYACLSEDTEVLTPDGWQRLYMTNNYLNKEVLIYDNENDAYRWEVPERWSIYKIKDTLIRIKSNNTDQLVTRNHRVLVERAGKLLHIRADEIGQKVKVPYLEDMFMLQGLILNTACLGKGSRRGNVLLNKLQTEGKHTETHTCKEVAHTPDERGTKTSTKDRMDGSEQSIMERRDNITNKQELYTKTWQSRRSKVREMSRRLFEYGKTRRMGGGAQTISSTNSTQAVKENGGSPPYRQKSDEQQNVQSNVIQKQQGTQNVRRRASYNTTMATTEEIDYNGTVYCPTVSTGCFVARRNGMIFLTGNSGFPKALNIGKAIDRKQGNEREVVAYNPNSRKNKPDKDIYEAGIRGKDDYLTNPSSDEAKEMDGSYAGFQPKPALEVIIVVMKPLSEKTYVEQALKNGKGVTWLDNCRMPINKEQETDKRVGTDATWGGTREASKHTVSFPAIEGMQMYKDDGRFPANLLVSDNALDTGRVSKSPKTYTRNANGVSTGNSSLKGVGESAGDESLNFGDEGDFSRYFDVDRWFEERVKELPDSIRKTYPFLIVPKPSKSEKNLGCEGIKPTDSERTNQNWKCTTCGKFQFSGDGNICGCENPQWERPKNQNNHPTVKSITLMSYLITLGSRKGDLVYDPFVGSGTTAIASELMERRWVASELDTKSCEIAKARLSAVPQYAELPTLTEVKKMRTRLTQKNLFDYS